MATIQERLLKVENDARYAISEAVRATANIDYLAMMSDIEIPTEEENENAQPEV